MTLILSKKDVMAVLTIKDCMDVVEKAFGELSGGTAQLPIRTRIEAPDGTSLYMPAYLGKMDALACKIVGLYPQNPAKFKQPVILGKVMLQDPKTGDINCIMDAAYLTAVRTGAASGVATKYLARKDAGQSAGIFGAGVQSRMQLQAVMEAREISKVTIYDTSDVAVKNFIGDMKAYADLEIIQAKSANEVACSDIICTVTSSTIPLFDGKLLKPGTHINGIGSHTPDARELDSITIKRSKFVADSFETCIKEAGDFIIPLNEGAITEDHFYAELGAIINGEKKGRENDSEITVFKSTGLAIQDAAAAKLVYEKAMQAGIGINVDI